MIQIANDWMMMNNLQVKLDDALDQNSLMLLHIYFTHLGVFQWLFSPGFDDKNDLVLTSVK